MLYLSSATNGGKLRFSGMSTFRFTCRKQIYKEQ